MSGLISGLAGAGTAASNTQGYYNSALQQLINAYGSPAATTFGNEEKAALQPQFNEQDQNLAANEAAMGITGSGAAKNDFGNLQSAQSATLAGNIAPLYSQALGEYGGILGQEPGAESQAYSGAISNLYGAFDSLAGGAGEYFGAQRAQGNQNNQPQPNSNPYAAPTPSGPGYGYGGA